MNTLLAVLALAAIAWSALWSTQLASHVERSLETRVSDAWTEKGAFRFDVPGRASGEPGYLTTLSPRVDVTFRWTLDDADATRATAATKLVVAVRAGARVVDLPLGEASTDAARDLDTTGTLEFAAAEAAVLDATKGRGLANATWAIEARTRFVADSGRTGTSTFAVPIVYDSPLYVLPGESASSQTQDHATRESVERVERAGPAALARVPAAPMLAVGGMLALAVALRKEGTA